MQENQATDAKTLWRTCSKNLQMQMSEATWKTWFENIEVVDLEESTLTLSVPSATVRNRMETRFLAMIEDTLVDIAGSPLQIGFEVRPNPAESAVIGNGRNDTADYAVALESEGLPGKAIEETTLSSISYGALIRDAGDAADTTAAYKGNNGKDSFWDGFDTNGFDTNGYGKGDKRDGKDEAPSTNPPAALNPRYTFPAFVTGSSNSFALAASQRVAETPATAYNPLFIHGDSGLGKTHLLHAIGHYVQENFERLHVRYVSTERFLNDFIHAIRNRGQMSFKRYYRNCDVLLIDDIQFMEGKESLQEEFFYTFEHLHQNGKQIVISSDRPPRAISTLEYRLRSRFESGLITDVQPPELETRLAILRKKADGERSPISDDVLELIATNVRDNIRELEGALIRVAAYASLNQRVITREKAEEVLADILDAHRPHRITPASILQATSDMFSFSVDDLQGQSRRRPLVLARQISMYAFREVTDYSYPAIAREFGDRDHTTVIHAVEKITTLMGERRDVYDQVTELIQRIRGSG